MKNLPPDLTRTSLWPYVYLLIIFAVGCLHFYWHPKHGADVGNNQVARQANHLPVKK